MFRLESTEHNGIYLYIDHARLINDAYITNADSFNGYQLKANLFNFKPKPPPTTRSVKARKRKAEHNNFTTDTLELKNTCDAVIYKLKETALIKIVTTDELIERIWEEPIVYPQLKGSNDTNKFQRFTLSQNEYLIPPGCHFFNHDVVNLRNIMNCLDQYDFVVIDPPWRNKYIRRIKKAKRELGYKMMHNDELSDIPLEKLIHNDTIVAIWCTNSQQHQRALLEEFLPRWDLCLFHRIVWLKVNTEFDLIGEINKDGQKQPYEIMFIARHKDCQKDFSELKKIEFLVSVPSIIHSHKPPLLDLFRSVLTPKPKCLELFARYLQPGFTSIGLEVFKLMDKRLYIQKDSRL